MLGLWILLIFPELVLLSNQKPVVIMKHTLETCFIWRIFKDEKFTTTFSRQLQWLIAITIDHFDFSLSKNFSSWNFQMQCNMNTFSWQTEESSTAILLPSYRHYMAKSSFNMGFNMIYLGWIPSLSSTYSVNYALQSFNHATCSPLKSFQPPLGS